MKVKTCFALGVLSVMGNTASWAGAVITYGATSLGVNPHGELNFFGNGPGGFMTYGVFRAGVGDAISPGCACEGWGVSVNGSIAGFRNRSTGNGGLGAATWGATAATFTSETSMTGAPITVRHEYGPSLATDIFQVNVRISNNSMTDSFNNVTYRRVMDWDIPPTTFSEFITHQGVVQNLIANGGNLVGSSNNGFASSNPLTARGTTGAFGALSVNTDFIDLGPADHGSVFDFNFGVLNPGESVLFNIFYGSRASEASAFAGLSQIGVADGFGNPFPGGLYSLGQNSLPGGATTGSPATFIFAFGGVGGVEIGTSPARPLLPFVPAPGVFVFNDPPPRRWFDPPFAAAFEYELFGGGFFTAFATPPADFGFGTLLFEDLLSSFSLLADPGVEYDISGLGTSKFRISGIKKGAIDFASPGFTTAFPTFLDFSGDVTKLTMTAIPHRDGDGGIVPEPSTYMLLAGGFVALGLMRRRAA
jgi:hypothetical protein